MGVVFEWLVEQKEKNQVLGAVRGSVVRLTMSSSVEMRDIGDAFTGVPEPGLLAC